MSRIVRRAPDGAQGGAGDAPRVVLVLGDQLSEALAALRAADKACDVILMAEVMEEATYVRHHPKKIAFLFSAMRHFAEALREQGWTVRYVPLDAEGNTQSIPGEILRAADEVGAETCLATEPGEFRLIEALRCGPIPVEMLEDDRFVASHAEFEAWAKGKKQLRMEYFYREMRRKTGLLMEGDKPAGGKWNFDHDNRKPPPEGIAWDGPKRTEPDAVTREVLDLTRARFASNTYSQDDFWFAVTRPQALAALDHFIREGLGRFGDYQDAMLTGEAFLYHALISPYLNCGLLNPIEVCRAAEEAWRAGHAEINAVEGFIRQIIGWREYVRGIYFLQGPGYESRNFLGHDADLPEFYWTGETDMHCVSEAVGQTMREAYAHHIQRLMVTGNFALLAGIEPAQVQDWYMSVYIDAYEWVMSANVIGMSQFADGGIVASKPYVSSGNYIDKMSDYCGHCAYSVKTKTGDGACPFNLLYWHFLDRHREAFAGNNRMRQMYATWDRMKPERRETVIREADAWLARMRAGERV